MFFLTSKVAWIVASPITLMILVGLIGVLLARSRIGRLSQALSAIALTLLLAVAVTPLGYGLLSPLENRFPQPPPDMPAPYGILILGGALNGPMSLAHNQATFEEGERVVQAALLARRYPDARVVFSGGNGWALGEPPTEAEAVRKLLIDLGVDPARITLEDRSRNTDENARFSAALLHPEPSQRWLLVTSAFHMPRSMGLFEKAGFNVTAYPVAFRTIDPPSGGPPWDIYVSRNMRAFEIGMREWIGLLGYRLSGRIEALFPGPADKAK
jgi:uncharacterized SAM-binding protein YcdF (DUF218 family)